METEMQLKDAIQKLEAREKESIKMLREADCMWMSMEGTYKKKMVETFERQKLLEKEVILLTYFCNLLESKLITFDFNSRYDV